MAFLVDEDLDQKAGDQSNPQNQVPAGQGAGLALPNTGAQSTTAGQPAAQQNQPSASGSYTNLQKYLDVNADQGQPLAERVGQETRTAANDARAAVQSGIGQFQGQVQSQVPQIDENLLKNLTPTAYVPGTGYHPSPFSPISQVGYLGQQAASTLPTQTADSIKKARTAQYQGPNSIEDTGLLQDAYNKSATAQDLAGQAQTEQGRFSLLQRMVKNAPSYTQGQQLLDQAILETHPEARQSLQNLQTEVGGLNNEIAQKGAEANALVAPAKEKITTQAQTVQQSLQSAIDRYLENLNLASADANSGRTEEFKNLNNLVSGWQKNTTMTPDKLNEAYQAIYGQAQPKQLQGSTVKPTNDLLAMFPGLSLSKYIQQSAAPTANTIANEYDLAELKALQDLSGDDRVLLDESQLGKYLPNTKFDSGQLEKDILDKLVTYKGGSKLNQYASAGKIDVGTPGNRDQLRSLLDLAEKDKALRTQVGLKQLDMSSILNQPPSSLTVNPNNGLYGNFDYNQRQEAAMRELLTNLFYANYKGQLDPSYVKNAFHSMTQPDNQAYQPEPIVPGPLDANGNPTNHRRMFM